MNFFKAEVKKYEKKYKKRTKSGKSKDATTVQFSIPLNKDNPFQEENFVYILTKSDLNVLKEELDTHTKDSKSRESDSNKYKSDLESLKIENMELNETLKNLKLSKDEILSNNSEIVNDIKSLEAETQKLSQRNEDLQIKLDALQSKYDRRQNKIDALSERLNKSLMTESNLERELRKYTAAIVRIETRGFMDRIFNRIPEDVKQLTSGIMDKREND